MEPYLINDEYWISNLLDEFESYFLKLEDDLASQDRELVTITGIEFCGCAACYSREQFAFMIPRIVRAFVDGTIQLN